MRKRALEVSRRVVDVAAADYRGYVLHSLSMQSCIGHYLWNEFLVIETPAVLREYELLVPQIECDVAFRASPRQRLMSSAQLPNEQLARGDGGLPCRIPA